ncbi:MAG: HAMP domain-containing sensor histidine kinase, partial [Cyanobacteria bacterium P01_H01_bin.152]
KQINIHEGLDSTLMLLQGRFQSTLERPAIQVIKQYATLPQLECLAGQLNQVFMNILSNAVDALEDRFDTQQVTTLQGAKAQIPIIHIQTTVPKPGWVQITIADNGLGMPEAVRENLFIPFYTTKPVGKGTGLGLSISYQIICDHHQGRLNCVSTPGVGTTFMIEIPVGLDNIDADLANQ